ncbi:cap-specific mRNA (nucleoside-2'-O-)-methyltransferase 2 [Anopheles maculipalpis]|uniref:cap-specific mRNA (nucleoside-2'-O-)-methyltransferase 2 n=1 Tax=Anopheles maculipalpis TaxID=1496333 RepID=UPI002159AFBE|nr:cap-specific mRNA (nucleoside-2'-O-)-methyltransferase 2 [Anopheles maculipalpis]
MEFRSSHSTDQDVDALLRENIVHEASVQFEKKFQFESIPANTPLPPLETLYRSPPYVVAALQDQKRHLNEVKNRLNDFEISDWHQHTRRRSSLLPILNELRYRIRAEFVTQAFTKLYECVSAYELINTDLRELYSVHLCEAPGAFITGLNHYIRLNCAPRTQWNWFACTLNPYYEGNCPGNMIPDDRFILHTLDSWCFGADGTGDIMVRENRNAIIRRRQRFPTVHLVTADGSIDCLNVPEEQEERVAKLHLAEAVLALSLLSPGQHFVLKMFTLFEHSSISLLYLLNLCFDELHVFKPCTSKPGNSEVYIVAKYYRQPDGIDQYLEHIYTNLQNDSNAMFERSSVPDTFLEQLRVCTTSFVRWQTDVIESNIRFYRTADPLEDQRLSIFKQTIMEMFFDRYHITPIRNNERIVHGVKVSEGPNINQKESRGTFNERVQLAATSDAKLADRLRSLRDRLDYLTLTRQMFQPEAMLNDAPLRYGPENGFHLQHELAFVIGKPIERVKSSKFALITCVRLLNDTIDLFRTVCNGTSNDPITVTGNTISIAINAYPSVTNVAHHEKELFRTIVRTLFQLIQQNCITSPLEHSPGTGAGPLELIVENWLPLTQVSVGLLYLLKLYVFKDVEALSPTRIAFRDLRKSGVTNLVGIHDAVLKAYTKASNVPGVVTKSLLAIVPITSLLDGSFHYAMLNYNNALCLIYCARLLEELKLRVV